MPTLSEFKIKEGGSVNKALIWFNLCWLEAFPVSPVDQGVAPR